ncbi:MAG: hypothetical protein C0467_24990 [Planctomycetaceae bacterium]|nr:hypothetical protein [Planctomycetaceae bacterium]
MSSAELPEPDPGRPFIRWLWTSNPFYVISAGLFLFGLRESFGAGTREVDTWALMGGLAGYTLLLAAAALLLVRFARVWDDVRTVLLLVVLMFLATSVTFDELLMLEPERGIPFNLGGFAFAVLVSEGVLRGIRLRLPALFRVPYHLTLALFFLYPVALTQLPRDGHSEAMLWGLWGFAPAAGLVFLTLLPAIRRGAEYVRDTGSPWPWPFYPWSVFVFLGAAVCGRAFLLCWSMHQPSRMSDLVFGPYFLVPFGFAITVIVLELGIVSGSRITRWVALAMPAGLVVLAGVGLRTDAIATEFLGHFANRLGGTPLFVALLTAGSFYLYAWVRRVPHAVEGMTAVLAALSVIGPETLTIPNATGTRVGMLVAAVGLQLVLALLRRDGWRLIVGGLIAGIWLSYAGWRGYRTLREEVPGLDYLAAGLALFPVAVLISLGKAGILARWWNLMWRRMLNARV